MNPLSDTSATNPYPSDDDCSGWSRQPGGPHDRRQLVDGFAGPTHCRPRSILPQLRGAPGMRVLVVEDDPLTSDLLTRALEAMGYAVTSVHDGGEAWSVLRQGHVPLVISDWMMPGVDGLELCRRIRRKEGDRYTYVVLVTGRNGDEDRLNGLGAGADDFLSKPVDIRELAARLKIAGRILSMQEELERKNAELRELATTDALTGLGNRRWFAESLEAQAALAVRQGSPLSLILLDVDHFKAFNDAFGHSAGDRVLCALSRVLRESSRVYDLVARYGGEEFAILLPDTDAPASRTLAERLRRAIEEADWPLRQVTASLGVATIDPSHPASTDLINEADRALYHSKRMGRNCVSTFQEARTPV